MATLLATEQLNETSADAPHDRGPGANSLAFHLGFWSDPPIRGPGDEHVGERSRRRARAGGLCRMVSRGLSASSTKKLSQWFPKTFA